MAHAVSAGGPIVAIGGGNIRIGETRRIDERVVELSGKTRPQVLFIPTASLDRAEYIEAFRRMYEAQLGCRVEVLALYADRPSAARMRHMVAAADIIYVGGGNTLRMMMLWRRLGVDGLLRNAHRSGTVLAGSSAGGICWFDGGHSDSRSFSAAGEPWRYIRVRGLGLLHAVFCPHYHTEQREESVRAMVARSGGVVIACDNCTAVETADGQWRVYRSRRIGRAYRIVRQRTEVAVERLPADHVFRPQHMLTGRGRVFG